jgi:beta-glucanase (GH16 family)
VLVFGLTHCYWITPYEDLTSGAASPGGDSAPPSEEAGAGGGADAASGDDAAGTPPSPITPPPGGPWTLSFHDEFEGQALDTTKWATRYPRPGDRAYSNADFGESQWYLPENVVVSEGVLRLVAKREDFTSPQTGTLFRYTSGMVQSKAAFSVQYGYIEARVRLPEGSGLWPSVWTWPENESSTPEIDVVAFYGDNVGRVYGGYHPEGGGQAQGYSAESSDWTAGWHVFAADWEPDRITFFIDGKEVERLPAAATTTALYLLVTFAVQDGTNAPAPNASTSFPSVFQVDYVRVWQR